MKMEEPFFRESVFTEYKATGPRAKYQCKVIKGIMLFRSVRKHVKEYDIVEVHDGPLLGQALCGIALKCSGVSTRISHSHLVHVIPTNWIRHVIDLVCVGIIKTTFNYFFSCSYETARIYGEKIINSERFKIINNAISVKKFSYNSNIRDKIRNKYNVQQRHKIIGNVARLAKEKNQLFLIDVFQDYHKIVPDSSLWIIGEGNCRQEIENRVRDYGLEKCVKLFGERNDVPDLLQAMDAFIMTSFSEGLCISALESQVAGLPTLTSTGIPEVCEITKLLYRIDLKEGTASWANKLISITSDYDRQDVTHIHLIENSDYNIETEAYKLQCFYCGKKMDSGPCADKK